MSEHIDNCLLCSSEDLKNSYSIPDFFGTKEEFQITECKQCSTRYTSPRPSEKEIITYYKSNSYVSHGDSVNGLFDTIYKSIQRINFKFKYDILLKYTLNKKHLDFGCGSGAFPYFLEQKDWEVSGIEPDQQARENSLFSNSHSALSDLKADQTFSSISLFHVLEHVHQLELTLRSLIDRLDRNGILMLALPNYQSYDAAYYGEYWAGHDVPRHLYHFSQKSIHQLAKTFGLNIVATHPMKFDSYYVSLLSEEYKTGSKKYFSAFINGYKSNRSARKTGEYSSLIYVLSK